VHKLKICFFFLLISLFVTPVIGAKAKNAGSSEDPNLIRLNNIEINKKTKEVRIKAQLAIKEGILEYFLVGNEGKTYESVLKITGNKPSELNFALLLIGCKPMNFEKMINLIRESDGTAQLLKDYQESLIELEIIDDGRKVDMQHLMRNRENTKDPLLWVYTGGIFIPDHGYAGDLELSYISVWPDPTTVINLFSKVKNPYSGNFGFEVNKDHSDLKIDQNFEIIIRRR
jgi:hypothetical protein